MTAAAQNGVRARPPEGRSAPEPAALGDSRDDAVPRFVPLPCALLDAFVARRLSAAALLVLCWLFLKAKLGGDRGVVWTSSAHVAANVPGISKDVGKRALRSLEREFFVRRMLKKGARGRHAFVLHGYVYFDAHRTMHVVNAAATTDPAHPATTSSTSKRPLRAPRPAPPRIEPEPEEHPSDALVVRANEASIVSEGERLALDWATECPGLAQPSTPLATGVRRTLDAAARREGARNWVATFRRVAASAFLSGRRTDFRASLTWVVQPGNLVKLDAGQYDDRPEGSPAPSARVAALHGVAARVAADLYVERLRGGAS